MKRSLLWRYPVVIACTVEEPSVSLYSGNLRELFYMRDTYVHLNTNPTLYSTLTPIIQLMRTTCTSSMQKFQLASPTYLGTTRDQLQLNLRRRVRTTHTCGGRSVEVSTQTHASYVFVYYVFFEYHILPETATTVVDNNAYPDKTIMLFIRWQVTSTTIMFICEISVSALVTCFSNHGNSASYDPHDPNTLCLSPSRIHSGRRLS